MLVVRCDIVLGLAADIQWVDLEKTQLREGVYPLYRVTSSTKWGGHCRNLTLKWRAICAVVRPYQLQTNRFAVGSGLISPVWPEEDGERG